MADEPRIDPQEEPRSFEELNQEQQPGILAEFMLFIKEEKKWWLTPIILVLLLVGLLVAFTQTGAAPFIYALF